MLESKAKWQFVKNNDSELKNQMKDLPIESTMIVNLLSQRGIATHEEITRFLSPHLDDLNSPKDLLMINKASKRVQQAISHNEKILVYGDYDADGICSTALLLKVLHELGATCDYYIPNRFTEGYGPNKEAFKKAYDQGFKVIITVDTGIASTNEAELAHQLGIDLIITDHHEIQEKLPNAYAIINPKCSPDFSFQELAGVGVAFKFAEYLLGYFPKHLLDLVAIGTIADLVPLVNDNRILTYYGLRELSQTKNKGLQALIKICNIDKNVTEEDVGFLIGPRINAVGRLKDATLAVQLLMANEQKEAQNIAKQINSINTKRQEIVTAIVTEAEQMVESSSSINNVIMVAKEGWNEGVLGIVASRLVQKYDRPTIVLTFDQSKEQFKGSARSIPAFNFFENCMKIRDLFTHFGGHSQAAGMTFPIENFEPIKRHLDEMIEQELTDEDFKQVIQIDQSVQVSDLNEGLFNELDRLAPFGVGNPKPIFHLTAIPRDARQIGHLKNHLKLQFFDKQSTLEGIGFGIGDLFHYITPHTEIAIVGEFGINEWNGVKTPQLVIKDMEISDWQLFDHRGKKDVDIMPFVEDCERNLMISDQKLSEEIQQMENVEKITYDTDIRLLTVVDSLYIFDIPPSLDHLKKIISITRPDNIHVCLHLENSTFLKPFPTREDFKWFYALLHHRKTLHLKSELTSIINSKGWTEDSIYFMTEVFLDLQFIKIDNNGVIHINPKPAKKDLQQSTSYKRRLTEGKIEQLLYYSNYKDLREWFTSCRSKNDTLKEEVVHGL